MVVVRSVSLVQNCRPATGKRVSDGYEGGRGVSDYFPTVGISAILRSAVVDT